MTTTAATPQRTDPRALPRLALRLGIALLILGWIASLTVDAQWPLVTRVIVDLGLAAVVAVPILNVIAVLAVEWQRRGRLFVLSAAVVLLMLIVNVLWRA